MLPANQLNHGQCYQVDGLGTGRWRPLWWDRSELVLVDVPAGRIKALIRLADLTAVDQVRLRYDPHS